MTQCQYNPPKKNRGLFGDNSWNGCHKTAVTDGFCLRHHPTQRAVHAKCDKCGEERVIGRTSFKSRVRMHHKCGGRYRKVEFVAKGTKV